MPQCRRGERAGKWPIAVWSRRVIALQSFIVTVLRRLLIATILLHQTAPFRKLPTVLVLRYSTAVEALFYVTLT